MRKISICINLDSRPGVDGESTSFTGHNDGCRNWDFFTHGVENKRKFFSGFDIEVIAYADETIRIPDEVLNRLRDMCDCVVIRKHFNSYRNYDVAGFANDIRYLQCLFMATGDHIVHFDADAAAFAREKYDVERWIAHLENYRFVSYFSDTSPRPVHDPSFGKHTWASTRAFATRRDWIKFDTLERMLREPEWGWAQFGEPLRKTNWLEHMLALSNEESAFYPPREDDRTLMFCWSSYRAGLLERLNGMQFEGVLDYVKNSGGICYPCDVLGLR
jgi:hypothetical protein